MDRVQIYMLVCIAVELVVASFFTGAAASDSHQPGLEILKGLGITIATIGLQLPIIFHVFGWL